MFHKTEADVIKNWQGDVSRPFVSVCCATYNHNAYIAKAIDSFLMQETEFPFEILIHDDASDDGTTDIVRQYAKEYQTIIRTVIQTENQYSKIPIIVPRFIFPLVRGTYVAICEGDDYWCSSDKLARQCEAMERHPRISLSFHPVFKVRREDEKPRLIAKKHKTERLIDSKRIILGGGGFCPTPSILLRSSVIPSVTSCVAEAPVGDKFIQIVASLKHGALFLPDAMAVYRTGHQGSWGQRINSSDVLRQYEKRIRFPYQWLYANCSDELLPILKFSEADQYAAIGRKCIFIGDFESAKRLLTKSAEVLSQKRSFRRLVQWFARGSVRASIFLAVYPGIRSIYRYISLSKNAFGTGLQARG